jgi:hypothetical protein
MAFINDLICFLLSSLDLNTENSFLPVLYKLTCKKEKNDYLFYVSYMLSLIIKKRKLFLIKNVNRLNIIYKFNLKKWKTN